MIIDFHTHIFPPQKATAILSRLLVKFEIPNFTDGTISGLQTSMQKAGVQLSLISRITTYPAQVKAVNDWLLGFKSTNILPMATIHPDQPEGASYIEDLHKAGFIGIKLHPDYQGFYADDRRLYPFYEAAQSLKMMILFHAGLDSGLSPPYKAMPKHLLKIHHDFPKLQIIAAHMGGEDNYEETEACLLGTEIYLDTAFNFKFMDPNIIKRFCRKHPVERILFGSDSPFGDQQAELHFIHSLPFLSPFEKKQITGLNAARLLNLNT